MNPGATSTYIGGKEGKMAQPGCLVLAGTVADRPAGEVLYWWAATPALRNLRGAAGRVSVDDIIENLQRWVTSPPPSGPFGDVRSGARAQDQATHTHACPRHT